MPNTSPSPSRFPDLPGTGFLVFLSLAGGSPVIGGEPPPAWRAEPSFEAACGNWDPIQFACTVLSAKFSRANFVASFRGGVHTVYVSEVLGHCPLLPGQADLLPLLPQGIQVLFATGDPPDYRTGNRPDIRQRLLGGSLPIVITSWSDRTSPLDYEETSFVRLIGGPMEASTGGENAAAFLRLRVLNRSDAGQRARVLLAINASNNGQPRGVSAPEYREALRREGTRLLGPGGKTRLLWKAPPGARVEAALRASVPRLIEWTSDGVEAPATPPPGKPFNRYFASKVDESHAAFHAADGLIRTFWRPPPPPPGRAVGIGLRFPEPRWLRRVLVFHDGMQTAEVGGYRLERLAGSDWVEVGHTVNGKARAELERDPEHRKKLGDSWLLEFEPVETLGWRLMYTRLPEGVPAPAVAEVQYQYSFEPPGSPAARWHDTEGDYEGNTVRFDIDLPPRGWRDVIACVPFLAAAEEEAAWLERRDFDEEIASVKAWWEAELKEGLQIEVPERVVEDVWNANLPHILTTTDIDPTNGLAITKTNIGWYEAVWPSLSAAAIHALDLRGHHRDAAKCLEPFLRWQGSMQPPGDYQRKEGFLAAADEYTWVRWVSAHGYLLWALSEHALLSGDREWTREALPRIVAACEWIERERERTKTPDVKGERPPHWGLLPPGVTGDGAPESYGFFGEACIWRGLDSAAALLESERDPAAGRWSAAAREYRECIERAARWAAEHAPPYRLKSGSTVPFVPIDLYNKWKTNTGQEPWDRHPWYLDVGPLHLVDQGVIDAGSDLAGWMAATAEDHWLRSSLALDEPWYAPQRAIYLGRDDLDGYLAVYYNLLAEGMDRQVHASVEGHGGVQNLPWGDGEHTMMLRSMLLEEKGEALLLARAIPRAWLIDGKRIGVKDAPTRFGKMSFSVQSNVRGGKITARVGAPERRPVPIRLRLRHPEGKVPSSVTVDGRPHTDLQGEWVLLPPAAALREVVASY